MLVAHQETIQEYYKQGSHFGLAVSCVAYNLASQLGYENNDYLWFAMIGLTELFIDDKIDILQYEALVDNFNIQVERLNPDSVPQSQADYTDLFKSAANEPSIGVNGLKKALI